MSTNFNSPHEEFWFGEFGNTYINRNEDNLIVIANINLFSKVLSSMTTMPSSFLEVGANIGLNIKALKTLCPTAEFTGIEVNHNASQILANTGCEVIESSILNANLPRKFDCVFSKGVLIHISPEHLIATYRKIYEWSKQFILIAEYYNPTPLSIPYRGMEDRLFKRDFAGEFLDLYPDLILRDYGFAYHRGAFPQDDINWFLLEKITAV